MTKRSWLWVFGFCFILPTSVEHRIYGKVSLCYVCACMKESMSDVAGDIRLHNWDEKGQLVSLEISLLQWNV